MMNTVFRTWFPRFSSRDDSLSIKRLFQFYMFGIGLHGNKHFIVVSVRRMYCVDVLDKAEAFR